MLTRTGLLRAALVVVTATAAAMAVSAQEVISPAPQQSFDDFLAGVRTDALARGISHTTLDAALGTLTSEPVVVARDRAQPEQVQSLESYVARRITTRTVLTAHRMAARHASLLRRVEAAYGVSSDVMIAIWGLESNFGGFTGSYPIVKALATLAYDGRRPLFRTELINALAILDQGKVPPEKLKGSWAGAMGQPQFMPSSFLAHAVDFDRDGQTDIWTSVPDVFGSMANYLKNKGWTKGERWGREVRASAAAVSRIERDVAMRTSSCRATRELTEPRPLSTWTKLGVTLANGRPLPTADMSASLMRGSKRLFLVYRNYEALLGYNCSNSYAVAVALLSDRITAR